MQQLTLLFPNEVKRGKKGSPVSFGEDNFKEWAKTLRASLEVFSITAHRITKDDDNVTANCTVPGEILIDDDLFKKLQSQKNGISGLLFKFDSPFKHGLANFYGPDLEDFK